MERVLRMFCVGLGGVGLMVAILVLAGKKTPHLRVPAATLRLGVRQVEAPSPAAIRKDEIAPVRWSAGGVEATFPESGVRVAARGATLGVVFNGIQVGDRALCGTEPVAGRKVGEERVVYRRTEHIDESYVRREGGVEQIWSFDGSMEGIRELGDLRIAVGFDTALTPVLESEPSVRFVNERGEAILRYGSATAIDAGGRRESLHYELRGHELAMTLDRGFLAKAEFPLTVDPVIAIASSTEESEDVPDVAFNDQEKCYLVAYFKSVQAVDGWKHGIYCAPVSLDGTVGRETPIEYQTSRSPNPPRVAWGSGNQFLVVWTQGASSPTIRGKFVTLESGIAVSNVPAFTMGSGTLPDVGYSIDAQRYFVVYESDGGIKVTHSGFSGSLVVSSGAGSDRNPTVTPRTQKEVGIVWSRVGADSRGRLYSATIAADMTVQGTKLITDESDDDNEDVPSLAGHPGSKYSYVTWWKNGRGVYTKRIEFASTGPEASPGELEVHSTAVRPHASMSDPSLNRLIVTYGRYPNRIWGVFAQVFDVSQDPPAFLEEFGVAGGGDSQMKPAVAIDNQGWNALIAFTDHKGTWDISGQGILLPVKPALESPSGGSSDLAWSSMIGATSYEIQLDDGADFGSPLIDQTTVSTSYALDASMTDSHYWWRVRATNGELRSDWLTAEVSGGAASVPAPAPSTEGQGSGGGGCGLVGFEAILLLGLLAWIRNRKSGLIA